MRRLTIVLAILGLVVASSAGASSYTVRRGDTLGGIAKRFGTSVTALVSGTKLKNGDHIEVGQALRVGDTPAAKPAAAAPTTYKVRKGDTLAGIAKRFGTTVGALVKLNA